MTHHRPPLDLFDRRLLGALQANAQARYADLGAAAHLSAPAAFERVKKLKRAGVIRRFTIDLDPDALGLHVCAFVEIALNNARCAEAAEALAALAGVLECHVVAGAFDIHLKVRAPSTAGLHSIISRVSQMPFVRETKTTMVLETYREGQVRLDEAHGGAGADRAA